MRAKVSVTLTLFLAFFLICGQCTLLDDIAFVHELLYQSYWEEDTDYEFMKSQYQVGGIFECVIHGNYVDKDNSDEAAEFRDITLADDPDMFITSVVYHGLIEAEQLGTLTIDMERFNRSLHALATYRDKNLPPGIPQYAFWQQLYVNGSWNPGSPNIFGFIDNVPRMPEQVRQTVKQYDLAVFGTNSPALKPRFFIPPDVDDSSVNIILLGLLKETKSPFYPYWQKVNFDLDGFYKNVLHYAYRPFSRSCNRSNEIDPRTYFILHDFLKDRKAKAEAKGEVPNIVLPTTWMLYRQQSNVTHIPLDINDVDASVNCNFLFGLATQIKNGYQPGAEVRAMMHDSADLVVYAIEGAVHRRPDIILMYYPSNYAFYWYASRLVSYLHTIPNRDEDLQYVYDRLSQAMRTKGTADILSEKKKDDSGSFWVEFMGNYGGKNRNDDAIYATAMVVNAFLDAWGFKKGQTFQYIPNTPKEVKKAVKQGIEFLSTSLKAKKLKLNSVFYSGSIKIMAKDNPVNFPANKLEDRQGNPIDGQKAAAADKLLIGEDCVKGFIKDEQYQQMLKLKWFGEDVPTVFEGYNDGEGPLFPFWTSPAIAEIMIITALSKYYRLQQ